MPALQTNELIGFVAGIHPPQHNVRKEDESAGTTLLRPLDDPPESGSPVVRDTDVTVLVPVARPDPYRPVVRIELNRVDVAHDPSRELEGFVPGPASIAALPDA